MVRRDALAFIDGTGCHQRKDVGIAVAASRCDFVPQENTFLLSFCFRFGCVHPPCVQTNIEQGFVHQVPVILPCARIRRIVRSHSLLVIWKMWNLGAVNEVSAPVHLVILLRARLKERPHRNHQMEIVLVELVHHAFGIGIILVEDVLALAVPPKPVLHDVIHRNVQVAILLCHRKNFLLRFVAVLALPKSVCPAPKHRRLAGQGFARVSLR